MGTFDTTLGALFIGSTVSAVFYGMFLLQVYTYCRRYPSDKVGYKAVVALLFLLETTHQAFIGHSVYYYSVTNFLSILALYGKPTWSLVFQLLIGAVVGTIVKFFFTIRVWRFSYGNVWLTAFLLLLTFGQLGLAIVYTLKSYALPALPDIVSLRVLGIVALGISVLNDMGIAVALCYYLQAMRSSYTQSDSLIRTLTLYAVHTGLLTSAMSFSTLIIYNCMPRNLIFVGCYFVLSKLYAMSFVATLNTRQTIRGQGVDGESKKFTTFEIVACPRSRSLNIPLQVPTSMGDTADSELRSGGENAASTPGFSEDLVHKSPDSIWMSHQATQKHHKPHYTVGW